MSWGRVKHQIGFALKPVYSFHAEAALQCPAGMCGFCECVWVALHTRIRGVGLGAQMWIVDVLNYDMMVHHLRRVFVLLNKGG